MGFPSTCSCGCTSITRAKNDRTLRVSLLSGARFVELNWRIGTPHHDGRSEGHVYDALLISSSTRSRDFGTARSVILHGVVLSRDTQLGNMHSSLY